MYLATCAKLPGTRAIVFSLFASPKTEIQYHVYSQGQSPARNVPLQGFNEPVPAIVLTKETYVPLIDCQSKCRVLMLERPSQGCLA
jgi:hypothetical protein